MAKTTTNLILIATLVATAACAGKKQEVLPPPPAPEQPAAQPAPPAPVDTITPGSRADFQRSVTSDTVHFALDQYDIDDPSRAILDSQAIWLARFPNVTITIEGHADERGTREYNLALGDRRANAAKNYLADKGIAPSRISTISYGKERPVALGSDEESWAQNRRAVTVVIDGAR